MHVAVWIVTATLLPAFAAAQSKTPKPRLMRPPVSRSKVRGVSGLPVDPSAIPTGWTCVGNCGTDGVDGVVTLSPTGNAAYEWVSTSGGTTGVGALPSGPLGSETNGSTLATTVFAAT